MSEQETDILPPRKPAVSKKHLALWGSVVLLAGVITGASISTVLAYDPIYKETLSVNSNNPADHAELVSILQKSQAYQLSNGVTETTVRAYSTDDQESYGNITTKEYYLPQYANAANCKNECETATVVKTDKDNLWLKINELEATSGQYSINQTSHDSYEVIYYDKTAGTEAETWLIGDNGLVKGITGYNNTDGIDETWTIAISYDVDDQGDALLANIN